MSDPSGAQSGADILSRIKPRLREERTQLCLRPDLLDEWEKANDELAQLESQTDAPKRMADNASAGVKGAKALAKRIKDLEAQIEETAVWFTMRAIPAAQWSALTEQHPPRKDTQVDMFYGFNWDAVMDEAVRLSMVDPVFDDQSWAEFRAVCNPSEWRALRESVESVNRAVTKAPKSSLAASVLNRRAATSEPRKAGE